MVNAFYFRELRPLINPTRDIGSTLYSHLAGKTSNVLVHEPFRLFMHKSRAAVHVTYCFSAWGRRRPIIHNRGRRGAWGRRRPRRFYSYLGSKTFNVLAARRLVLVLVLVLVLEPQPRDLQKHDYSRIIGKCAVGYQQLWFLPDEFGIKQVANSDRARPVPAYG